MGAGAGLTIAAASAEPGVSAASVYRWKKLLAESPVSGRHRARPVMRTAGTTRSPRATLPFLAVQVRGVDRNDNPARPSEALDSSRSVLRIVLPNGVVIHVAGDVDGDRLGDVVIAAGQIPGKATAVASCGSGAREVPSC
ncbi:MAG UNVERIFIED_CONTAM: hypothetical protein LVR18_49205 [Planctomycetaceae bacterium]